MDVEEASEYDANYYLFDAPGTVYKGGSGVTFDWELLKGSGISSEKIILAGGLNVGNVKEAVRAGSSIYGGRIKWCRTR